MKRWLFRIAVALLVALGITALFVTLSERSLTINWELTFLSNRDGVTEIYTIREGRLHRLTNSPTSESNLVWSPDGTMLAFENYREFQLFDGGSGSQRNLEIWVMNADGSDLRALTNHPAGDVHPAWSPDSSTIAFIRREEDRHQILSVPVDLSSTPRVITDMPGFHNHPIWMPDRAHLLFESDAASNITKLYQVHIPSAQVTQVSNELNLDERAPVLSADGETILFQSYNRDPNHALFVLDVQTQRIRPLAPPGFFGTAPQWSPDGNGILVSASYPNAYRTNLFILNWDGEARQITNLTRASATQARWSPDGSQVAFVTLRTD